MPDIFISDNGEKKEKIKVKEKPAKDKEEKISPFSYSIKQTTKDNPFASFIFRPNHIDFEIKDEEEKVILFLRKHPITNIKWAVIALILVTAPILVGSFPIFSFLPKNYHFIAILGWYLLTLSYIIQNFLSWYYQIQLVTDERIVDIDFYNLIYKEVSDCNIDKIQDVKYSMGGVIRTIFNFGDLMIQTASEVPNFKFEAIPDPNKVAKILQDLREEEQQEALEGRVR